MKARAPAWSAVGVLAFTAIACSSGDGTPADMPGQAGTNATVAGGAAVAGTGSNVGGNAQAGTSTAGVAGGSVGGSSSGAAQGGSSSGGANLGGASSGSGGAAGAATGKAGASSGGGGSGGGSSTAAQPSMGCNKPVTATANQWVESMVMTSGANRPYSVRLPTGYDQTRAYPVIVVLHGCGGGTNNVPMEKATGSDAILVRGTGSAADTCWETSATGKDVTFFDDIVKDVKARFCADEHRFFVVGYSSGSWLVNQLTCIRTDILRGGASVTGGESSNGKCGTPVARIFIHDSDDTTNVISGSIKARDRQLKQNMCATPAASMPVDPSPCALYQGCAAGYPVEWCQTSGKMHARQDDFAPSLFWNFFKGL